MASRRALPRLLAVALAASACRGHEMPVGANARPDSLLARGEEAYLRGRYDSARAMWSVALERSRSTRDSLAEARALTWLGLAAWRTGDYRAAQRLGEQALELKRRWALDADLFKSYNALGLLAWNEGRFSQATELFGRASAAAQAAGDRRGVAAAAGNLALVLTELGEFAEARRGFDSARVVGHALGDARVEGNALNNLAMLAIRTGAPQQAVPELTEARRLYRSIGYATGEQQALGQLGTAYDALGEPRLALAALDTALALARAQGLRQDEASDLEALAELYHGAGDHHHALSLYAEAAVINRDLGLAEEVGADLRSEAEIHASMGAADRARSLSDSALSLHRAAGARFEELADLLLLAELANEEGDAREADGYLAQARSLAATMGVRRARTDVALATARVAARRGDASVVLRTLRDANADLTGGGYGIEHEAYRLVALAHARLGALDSAAESGRRAVAALERTRGRYGSGMLRTSYLADKQVVYGDLVDVLRRMRHTEEAMEVADAARGRAFLESLGAAREGGGGRDAFERGLGEGEELLLRIDTLATQVGAAEQEGRSSTAAASRARLEDLKGRLDAARGAYEDLAVRMAEIRSTREGLAGSAAALVRKGRATLRPDEALLEYLVTDDSLVMFVATRSRLVSLATGLSAGRLASRIRLARELIIRSRSDPAPAFVVLDSLHELLIGPARRAAMLGGVRRLILVPHGLLTYVPFAALRDPASGRYLAQDFVLVTLPSAAALAATRNAAAPLPEGTAAYAAVFAPEVGRLPATATEARVAAYALGSARVFSGDRADEAAVRAALGGSTIVHLATHAEMNPRNPLFSYIQLARGSGARSTADGRLDVHEILGLRIQSDLVFLSGCETALGAGVGSGAAAGEDYATLAHAFLYAGARGVVATLWRVEDRGAAEFAAHFYQHFSTVPAAEALALAQRALLAGSRYRAPYYWAGYVLSGEGGAGVQPSQNGKPLSVR